MEKHCSKCGKMKPLSEFSVNNQQKSKHQPACKACLLAQAKPKRAEQHKRYKTYLQKLQLETFNAYGGPICACCKETNILFLTLDHINGVTKEERKTQHSGWTLYQRLRQQNYPEGFQVLCYNCNCGRARNHGVCPHKETSVGGN